MDVSQTTRVRRVMLHFADVAPTGARARRGARARNARAERTKTAARVFSRGRANRGRRDATRGDGAAARRGRFRESPKPGVGSPYTKKKKKKKNMLSSRRARFDRVRAEGAPASVDRRPRAPVARRAPRRAPGRALGDRAGGNRPTRRPGVGSRSPDPPPPAMSAEGKTKQPTRATIAKKKKSAASSPRLVRARASSLEGHETVFRRGKRTLERSSARPPPARADASLGVSFAPRDGAFGGRARARRRVGEGVASRRARTNKINPRRRRGRAPSLAVTGSAWAPRFAAGVSSFGAWVRTGGSGVSAARPWGWDGGNARRRRRRRWSNDGERWRKIARGRLRRRRGRTGGAVDAVAGAVALGASDFTSDGGFASKSARVRGVGMSGTAENRASRRVVETREAA